MPPASGQVTEEWVAKYNGPGNGGDSAIAIAIDIHGNVYVSGSDNRTGANPQGEDYLTIKYDSSGNQLWTARYNGQADQADYARAIAVDKEGNVYVTGESESSRTGTDFATVKYDNNGNQLWVARYDGPAHLDDGGWAIALDGAGGVIVTGPCVSSGTDVDYATIKYNAEGEVVWVALYEGPAGHTDVPRDVGIDGAGNVYVAGSSMRASFNFDIVTIKYNNAGAEQWVARYTGSGSQSAFDLAVSPSGNSFVAGWNYGTGGQEGALAIKYDALGNQEWVGHPGNSIPGGIAIDAEENVYVAGEVDRFPADDDMVIVKYSGSGSVLWYRYYDGPTHGDDRADALTVDSLGSVYIAGPSDDDYATVKYSSSGVSQWAIHYAGPGMYVDQPAGLAVDDSLNVFVTGWAYEPNLNADYTTIKYSQETRLSPSSFSIEKGYTISGDLNSLMRNDDNRLAIRPGPVIASNTWPIRVMVTGQVPSGTNSIRVVVVSSSPSGAIQQMVDAFNVGTNQWDQVGTSTLSDLDTTHSFLLSNPSTYTNPSQTTTMRISARPYAPVLVYPWQMRIDEASWRITP
jgi:hypothetical protein